MCMGPPLFTPCTSRWGRVYPHVYGATGSGANCRLLTAGLSPCVWGHHLAQQDMAALRGSIPMCMGPPQEKSTKYTIRRVYPHVYGATAHHIVKSTPWSGAT